MTDLLTAEADRAADARRPRSTPWPAGLAVAAGLAAALAGLAVLGFLLDGATSAPLDWLTLLTDPVWDPTRARFGAAAMIWGTAAVCLVALLVAVPLGWAAAIGLTELTPARTAQALRAGVEMLAAIPSIVYGLVGLALLRPLVSAVFGVPGGDGLLTAGLILAVMVLPTIVAVSIDALAAVPAQTREAAAALGLTRTEVVRAAVLPDAAPGMRAAVLLGLARALGETIAVFLVIGRADGRLPAPHEVFAAVLRPGQTLTTKIGGPEAVLAGAGSAHWAGLSALGLLLLALVVLMTLAGLRRSPTGSGHRQPRPRRAARELRDRAWIAGLRLAVLVPLLLVAGVFGVLAVRGAVGWNPAFWFTPAAGSGEGGVRDQILGTAVLVIGTAALAAPIGLGLGLLIAEYAGRRAAVWLRTATVTLGGVPSILLGLITYDLVVRTLGWGKSWLAGTVALAVLVVPVAAMVTASRIVALPPARREAALALGLNRTQFVRSVLVPWARPGLLTGSLLGLARAAGETAPLLFAATVFAGAAGLPSGIAHSPVVALPTHVFTLAQDSADPAALDAAWGAALVLVLISTLLLLAAVPARRRMEADL